MITIVFESHSTTVDNEAHLASGLRDVVLSPTGIIQSEELGMRYKNDHFDAIFCSTLRRSYETAELAFGLKFPIIKDARLNECDYGVLEGESSELVHNLKAAHIAVPFQKGESYTETTEKMKSFLSDLKKNYPGKKVMIIGHRATQYALENLINGVPLATIVTSPWKWQPGWTYTLADN